MKRVLLVVPAVALMVLLLAWAAAVVFMPSGWAPWVGETFAP